MNRNLYFIVLTVSIFFMFSSCKNSTRTFFREGVSYDLAEYRYKQIYDVHYNLDFHIPDEKSIPVKGSLQMHFKPLKARHGVILDFQPGEEYVHQLRVNGDSSYYYMNNGHIYIDADHLVPRQNNIIEIDFTASDQALNRSEDFMYTLLVPDKASTVFPCFDQPDMKATFDLTLHIPQQWKALSNGSEVADQTENSKRSVTFSMNKRISTYLFAFTAGDFQVESETRNNRTINVFHRETDSVKVNNNLPDVFQYHFHALQWLEDYTGIPYPYPKFDLAILPGFQYSGMEHPGAIWYRDTRLFLDDDAGMNAQLRKSNLIAHETAHMWFGNLVTMKWFDDVWLKEVFAGFMADKITAIDFPSVNHDLRFFLYHYPKAYRIDRSKGNHPVKQTLDNLNRAGTLYGPIIYNKAPVVFDQLEQIMTPSAFQSAVKQYLISFMHANATWDDLVTILDDHSSENIQEWSDVWLYGRGMPHISYEWKTDRENEGLYFKQTYPDQDDRLAKQYIKGVAVDQLNVNSFEVWMQKQNTFLNDLQRKPNAILANGQGKGYGWFHLPESDASYLIQNFTNFEKDIHRAAIVMNVYENFLRNEIPLSEYQQFLLLALDNEENPLIQSYLIEIANDHFFHFTKPEAQWGIELETILWEKLISKPFSNKTLYFDLWIKVVRSDDAIDRMTEIYETDGSFPGFKPSERQFWQMALELYMHKRRMKEILYEKMESIDNQDRKKRLAFILPALSPDEQVRDAFFASLADPDNRNPEPWVTDALYFLHHPLHPGQGLDYLASSLQMLPEIQQTGDIFFPQNWLAATIGNYHQPIVMETIRQYLDENQDLPDDLKNKVLQSMDLLMRAVD
ncbi:MAG: M1 family metallopeptidase [Bacteroidales bacterium]